MEHGDDCCDECVGSTIVGIVDVAGPGERKSWANVRLSPAELRPRALKGWITRRRGGKVRHTEIARAHSVRAKPTEPPPKGGGRKIVSSGRPSGKLTPKQRAQQRAQNINAGKPTHSGSGGQATLFVNGQQQGGGSRGSGRSGGQSGGQSSGQSYRNQGWTKPKGQGGGKQPQKGPYEPPPRPIGPPRPKYQPPPPPVADPNAGIPKSRTAPLTDAEAKERERWFMATMATSEWGHQGPHDTTIEFTDPTTGAWNADRQALHTKMLTDRVVGAINRGVPQGHKALLVTGQSGSGKSTALTNAEVVSHFGIKPGANGDLDNYLLVDADEFKAELLAGIEIPPGFTREEASYLVHEESLRLASALAETAKQAGLNYVLNITGGDYDRAESAVKDMQAAGYEVDGLFVDVSVDKAARAAKKRWRDGLDRLEVDGVGQGGRFVPESRIRRVGQLGRRTPDIPHPVSGKPIRPRSAHRGVFQGLLNLGLFSKAIVIDNEGDGSTEDYPNKVALKV